MIYDGPSWAHGEDILEHLGAKSVSLVASSLHPMWTRATYVGYKEQGAILVGMGIDDCISVVNIRESYGSTV